MNRASHIRATMRNSIFKGGYIVRLKRGQWYEDNFQNYLYM